MEFIPQKHGPSDQVTKGHQDIEYEIGALASRHGISTLQAREIVERCGSDLGCIDAEARKLALH